MPKKLYEFYFKKDSSTYYYVNSSGVVDTSATAVDIKGSVVDWKALDLGFVRDRKYHGVFRKQAPEKIKIAGDGANILRWVKHYQGGTNAKCSLVIMMLRSTDQEYYLHAEFNFNFKIFESSIDYVDIALIEGGIRAKINAYDTTQFAIPLVSPDDDEEVEYMLTDGVLFDGKFNFIVCEFGSLSMGAGVTLPLRYKNQEGSIHIAVPNSGLLPGIDWPGGDFDSAYALRTTEAFTGKVNIGFKYEITGIDPGLTALEVWVEIRGKKPTVSVLHNEHIGDLDISGGLGSSGVYTGTMASPFSFGVENYIFVYLKPIGGTVQLDFASDPGNVEITYKYTFPKTATRAIKQYTLLKRLVQKITGEATPVSSILLTTDVYPDDDVWNLNPFNTYITSGDALRNIYTTADGTISNPDIKTTLEDFRKDAITSLCAGIGIETISGIETVVLEHLSHFYQTGVLIADIGDSIGDNWRRYPYTDYMANSIKAGYKDQNYDEVNGRNEFNSEVNFQTTDERAENDADYTSSYRTGCYDIEFIRLNLSGKKSTDNNADNGTFKLQSNGNTELTLVPVGMGYGTVTARQLDRGHTITGGIPADVAPTVFNVPFSPKRNMLRLIPFLKSVYDGLTSPSLIFQTSTKNSNLVASMYIGGTAILERDDIDVMGSSGTQLWIPEVFEVTAESPINLNAVMSANPYGEIGFTIRKKGVAYALRGFVLEAGINTSTRQARTFKFLLSPTTPAPYNL